MRSFKLPSNATKAQIIERYDKLLAAFEEKSAQLAEARSERSSGSVATDRAALELAESATVESVVDGITRLRVLFGQTANELSEQLTAQAERLSGLKRAVTLQEGRLQELYELETGADALQKLAAASSERRAAAEAEFTGRLEEMESEWAMRLQALETRHAERKAQLEADNKAQEAEAKVFKAAQKQQRTREEAEYTYNRDRARKLEEDTYAERRAAQEKALVAEREAFEKELADRQATVAAAEAELGDLRERAGGYEAALQATERDARKAAGEAVRAEAKQQAKLAAVEREWERKVLEQRIAHLEQQVTEREAKIADLSGQLVEAQTRVTEIAEKAIGGSSIARAYESVNQIALEQARRPETPKPG